MIVLTFARPLDTPSFKCIFCKVYSDKEIALSSC